MLFVGKCPNAVFKGLLCKHPLQLNILCLCLSFFFSFEKVLGYHQHNRSGLGSIKQTEVPPKQTHDYRKLVSDKVHDLEEEQYFAKAVQLRLQGNWTR